MVVHANSSVWILHYVPALSKIMPNVYSMICANMFKSSIPLRFQNNQIDPVKMLL